MSPSFADYRQLAKSLSVDALALVPGPNFTRVLGQEFMSHERPFVLVIPAQGVPAAIVPNLELGSWELVGFDGVVFDWRDQDGYQPAFDALAEHMRLSSLAVEGQVMRVFVHHALKQASPEVQIIDAEKQISGLRMIKTEADLAAMQAAIDLSERALHQVLETVEIGQSEKEIEGRLIQALFAEGADGLAFTPIVVAGDNSARVHGHAREDYKIQSGDALLFDFGARKGGFCADITRTVFVGEVSAEGRAVYETVLAANMAGLEATRAGVTAHQIDDVVTGVLESSPYGDHIRTKTGHGLGRDVHEAPYVMRGNHQELPAGTVYTNEPGLYLSGKFGVRIEDDVLVTEDGCQVLTNFPKDLLIVGG
ncbi:Xaa-Pro peptidase family protein [Pseudophaeobacter sp.]|uniref:Xaa-Pro peptidase family protein n=1 Tax=Pseudophaeobacter sp. TaxID=1971739 RepID=UPI0032975F1C